MRTFDALAGFCDAILGSLLEEFALIDQFAIALLARRPSATPLR